MYLDLKKIEFGACWHITNMELGCICPTVHRNSPSSLILLNIAIKDVDLFFTTAQIKSQNTKFFVSISQSQNDYPKNFSGTRGIQRRQNKYGPLEFRKSRSKLRYPKKEDDVF